MGVGCAVSIDNPYSVIIIIFSLFAEERIKNDFRLKSECVSVCVCGGKV